MPNVAENIRDRKLPTDKEITDTLAKADTIEIKYFRLRVKALISMAKKFGKRRAEIRSLLLSDLEVKDNKLYVTFTLRKKHKRGLFQYFKHLEKQLSPDLQNKTLPQLEADWRTWTETPQGYRIKEERRIKSISTEDKYAKLILEYVEHLKKVNPTGIYLFPSGKAVFNRYFIHNLTPLSGRQLLRIIKPLNPKLWLHLFREMKGAEIAKDLGNNIIAVAQVQNTLDLERQETAYHYIQRYAAQEMKTETA